MNDFGIDKCLITTCLDNQQMPITKELNKILVTFNSDNQQNK